jgi:hypothetical protein
MRKFGWMLATLGGAALIGTVALQGVAASAAPADHGGHDRHGQATVLQFETMTPVTGPYVGAANPLRGVVGGGLPWVLTSGTGSLRRDGRLFVRVRGLVLARQAPVPPALRGTNPFTAFRALVSCQSIGTGNTATVANVSTGDFKANSRGDSTIHARISLPRPCVAPIVFVTGPTGTDAWFAVTGS